MFYKLMFNQNGHVFDPQEKNKIVCKEIKRQAPVYEVNYEEFQGTNGSREINASFRPFELVLTLDIFYKNKYDKELILTELYEMIFVGYQYYIGHDLSPGKRFKVNPKNFELTEEANDYSTIEITFDVPSGCSESLSTTLNGFTFENVWQFSQGLISEDYKYKHKTSNFIIYNAGSFEIDPREHYLKIKLEGESEGNVTIFNKTTGDRFIYYPSLSANLGQTLVLEGVIPKLNGVSCGINTNHGLINLVEGINEIEIQNITRVKSSWDFRFLYK
ncbi:phage tail family protein [Enterococcus faecium]|uniref:phage tail domain-containing protein n=1 Tax=Enterococcus faecium TaxID=1352 RepID=UPI000CF067B9|nr:phage tail domain-containing protein [Enterococcus faecium]EGP5619513.1 phage tail family protein [Enterococcus faecium]PQB69783.1 phage tail family protein [Enterococcus faecium]PQC43068.1 phage tail family protein [Enterococcus faecium]